MVDSKRCRKEQQKMQREQFQNAVSRLSVPFARVQMRSLYLTPIALQHIRHKKHETLSNACERASRTHFAISPQGAFLQRPRTKSLLRRRFDAGGHVVAAIPYAGASRAPFSRPRELFTVTACRTFLPVPLNLLHVFPYNFVIYPVVTAYFKHFRSIIACGEAPRRPEQLHMHQ